MKYKLLALDVDGTLLGPDQRVPPDSIAAIADARAAGLYVCLATGRSRNETLPVWRQLRLSPPYEPMIVIGGTLVSEPDTGRTLYQKTIPAGVADEYAAALVARGLSAMAIVDAWRHEVEYLAVQAADWANVQRMWFGQMTVRLRSVRRLSDDDAPPPLRINALADAERGPALAAELEAQFAGRLNVHSIFAPNYGVTVVEAFAPSASKWTGIVYVAQGLGIAPAEIVAVGDDVNDVPMLRAAGLGVAMPWATPPARAAAQTVAEPNLAAFIRGLLR